MLLMAFITMKPFNQLQYFTPLKALLDLIFSLERDYCLLKQNHFGETMD